MVRFFFFIVLFFSLNVYAVNEENWVRDGSTCGVQPFYYTSQAALMAACDAWFEANNDFTNMYWASVALTGTDTGPRSYADNYDRIFFSTETGRRAGEYRFAAAYCLEGYEFDNRVHDCVQAECVEGEQWNADTAQCEPAPPSCDDLAGQPATGSGWFGGYTSAQDFLNLSCSSGCIALFNGSGPYTFPNSNDPTSFYFQGQFVYSEPGEECTAGDIPVQQPSPPEQTQPPEEQEGNGDCPNGWFLQRDGSCSPTSDPSYPLNSANCPEGTYYVAELGICLGYNDTVPSNPNHPGMPTGGGDGGEPQQGGNDGEGEGVEASGIDTDGDGETNDEGFCTQYPDSPICRESSYVDRGCRQQPACSGDAVQCAIALENWRIRCSLTQEGEDFTQQDVDNIFQGDGDVGTITVPAIDISTQLDTSSVYADSCPPPYSLTILNNHFQFDFSPWCDLFQLAGYFLLAIGFLVSARIVGIF